MRRRARRSGSRRRRGRCRIASKERSRLSICGGCPTGSPCRSSRRRRPATTRSRRTGATGPAVRRSTARSSRARVSSRVRCSASNRAIVRSVIRRAATSRGSTRGASRLRSKSSWLDDDRFNGSLTGALTFTGSGRTVDDLVLNTNASLVDSTLAGARFPSATVEFQMRAREDPREIHWALRRAAGLAVHGAQGARRHGVERISGHGCRTDRSESRSHRAAGRERHRDVEELGDCRNGDRLGTGDRLVRQRYGGHQGARPHGTGSESQHRGHPRPRRHRRIEVRLRHCGDEPRTSGEAVRPAARRFGTPRWRRVRAVRQPDDCRQARRKPAALQHDCRRAHCERHLHRTASEFRYRAGAYSGRHVRDLRHGGRPQSSARDGEDGLRKKPAAIRHDDRR